MISKKWLFSKGGRPVIYQPTSDYDNLPTGLKYLHQIYDPVKGIDYTWEREWRIRSDYLELDPSETTVIVPNRFWENKTLSNDISKIQRASIAMMGTLPKSIIKISWHCLVLEDLGVDIPDD